MGTSVALLATTLVAALVSGEALFEHESTMAHPLDPAPGAPIIVPLSPKKNQEIQLKIQVLAGRKGRCVG
jgi:hypothetical protein